MSVVGDIQKRLKFGLSTDQEDRFRQANFGKDIAHARIFIILILLPFVAILVNDYGFFGPTRMFYGILALRLVIVAYTILFLKSLRGLPDYLSYDRAEFYWGLSLALAHIMANSTRPENFFAHTIAIVVAISITVIAIPNRFTNQFITAIVYVVGQTLIIAPNIWTSPLASFTVLLNMFIATAVVIIFSWLLHFWRRREFLTHEEIEEARAKIEMQLTELKQAEKTMAKIDNARQKEIHHRIKNNLQIISSLLDLAAEKFNNRECIQDYEVIKIFKESRDRVISMAFIHEELYKGEGFETLKFSPYIKKLAENLFQTYKLIDTDISLSMDVEEDIFFNMDIAVPLGIIVNELVSNSFKHAFKGRDTGEIRIKLYREENSECINGLNNNKEACKSTDFVLVASDNGVGIPESLDIEDLESLGLQLVVSLVDQLDGELELKRENGTEFIIKFTVTDK